MSARGEEETVGKVAKATEVVNGEGDEGGLELVEGVDNVVGSGVVVVASVEFAVNAAKMGLMKVDGF